MRWFKVAAIAAGILIAFFAVSAVIGYLIDAVMIAAVVAVIVLAVKVARSGKQVSRKNPDREIRQSRDSGPRHRQKTPDVDDELARLKREMRN